jgi:hypothetical protein
MTRPGYSDRATLRSWADRREADSELPRLVRKLILETTPGLVELGIPAGDGVSLSGWDGTVTSTEGSVWVPKGRSLWELSTEVSANRKADSDYANRVANPAVPSPDQCTYVQAIVRAWNKRSEWADSKSTDGVFGDVLAHGLDDIDAWLEDAPATWAWFSEQNGLSPYGLRTAETWWSTWSSRTSPELSAETLVAGRDAQVSYVTDRIGGAGFVATIGGSSRDDVCAFLAACGVAQDRAGDGGMLARMVFVDEITAWRGLLESQRPLVLVPFDPDFANEVPPDSPHWVLVPTDRSDLAEISLPPLDAAGVAEALKAAGVDDDQLADEYGRLARRSLIALRRRLGVNPALTEPIWSRQPVGRATRACLLAGGWADGMEGDRAALAELSGEDYDDFIEMARGLDASADPLVSYLDGGWHLVDALDAWQQLSGAVTAQDLDRLTSVMSTVLGEVDPALELPQDERWWRAAFDGKQRVCSQQLRQGLANTLALLGQFGHAISLPGGRSGADLAASVVHRLLADANGDESGMRWASIADLLPLMAESAPDTFLAAVQEGLAGESPVLATMFTDTGNSFFGAHSPHTNLLWALEGVAWSSSHLGMAVELLAQLAETDPGGDTTSRPLNSLTGIFCPWHPDNTASDERRLRIIDAIRQRHTQIAWEWLLTLLPESYSTHFPTHAPKYRDWKPASPPVTYSSLWAFTTAVVERCIEDAGTTAGRWLTLIDKLGNLSPGDRDLVLTTLMDLESDGDSFEPTGRTDLWDALRAFAAKHRTFADAGWSLPEDALQRVDELAERFAPAAAHVKNRWLFAEDMPDFGDIRWSDDHEAYQEALRARRQAAVEEILNQEGMHGVLQLADGLDNPWSVGVALADAGTDCEAVMLDLIDSTDYSERALPWAYVTRRFRGDGWEWLDAVVAANDLSAEQRARLLLSSADYPAAWDRAGRDSDVDEVFWREFRQYGLGPEFPHVDYAARRLMEAGRHQVALDLVNLYARRGGHDEELLAQLAADGLDAMLSQPLDENEVRELRDFWFGSLFALLERNRDTVGVERVARLEWAYLPALGFEPSIPALEESLAHSPDLFVEVVCAVYKPRASDADDESAEPHASEEQDTDAVARAMNAHRLLSSWRRPPGSTPEGVDEGAMNAWVDDAIERLDQVGRLEAGLTHIGHVLTYFPPGDDGVRPPQAVRDLIERVASTELDGGFYTEVLNSRGLTSRGPEDGGAQEEALVRKFRADAEALADDAPRTAVILRRIADSYEREGRRNDENAERFRRGL